MTIIKAVKRVMRQRGSAMTAREAYQAIAAAGLYEFHAQRPEDVVSTQIRRHCVGVEFPTAAETQHFELVGVNRYWLVPDYAKIPKALGTENRNRTDGSLTSSAESLETAVRDLERLHEQYLRLLKGRLLSELKKLTPAAFELFAKQLMDVYGFEDTAVTRISGDGGIDGHGKLAVGVAHLNVAFQCKRYTRGTVQRPEIDSFRGAIQGDYEQGLFFTTSRFSQGAIEAR